MPLRLPSNTRVPFRSTKPNFLFPAVLLSGSIAVATLFAVYSVDLAFRLAMSAVAANIFLCAIGAGFATTVLRQNVLRFDSAIRGLRFTAPAIPSLFYFAAGVLGLVPGVVALTLEEHNGALIFVTFSLLNLAGVVKLIIGLRIPSGLTLTDNGLRGIRGTKRLDITWTELSEAKVVMTDNHVRLTLLLASGAQTIVEPHHTGSDTNIVAHIINFFLAHPEHRKILSDPTAALALVKAQ